MARLFSRKLMRRVEMLLAALAWLFGGSFFAQPQDRAIDAGYYYRLTNAFLGDSRALDTYSDGANDPFMGKSGDVSGQLWKLTRLDDGTYRLTNSFLGSARALDTYSGDPNQPFMGTTDQDYTGQHWKLTPLDDGTYRLTNLYLGYSRALDTYSDGENQPFMGKTDQDYSGQHWKLTKIRRL